jgi:hypothetical protein
MVLQQTGASRSYCLCDVLAAGAVATQGLQQSSLFSFEGSAVKPVLQRLDVPVRAIIAPFSDGAMAGRVVAAVRRHLLPLMAPAGVWLQNDSMYHSTLWHASHHQASRHPTTLCPLPQLSYMCRQRSCASTCKSCRP